MAFMIKLQAGIFALLLAGAPPGVAATNEVAPLSPEDIRALRQRVEQLEEKVKRLEQSQGQAAQTNQNQRVREPEQQVNTTARDREHDQQAAAENARRAPQIILGEQGFSFTSADTNFNIQLRGDLQVDSRTFFNGNHAPGSDGILLRRARPTLQGTVFRDFDFLFVPDFGGSGAPQIYDAFLNYRYRPELQLMAGKFKTPVGLEQLQADRDLLFNERALPTDLVPNRDIGFELHGDLWGGAITYAAGLLNGVGDGRNSGNAAFDDGDEFAGRLFLRPFKATSLRPVQRLGFGVAGSYQAMQSANIAGLPNNVNGTLATPGYLTAGQQQFFAYNPTNRSVVAEGQHWRLSPQGTWFYGPFGLMGSYVISDQQVALAGDGPRHSTRLRHTAWQIQADWVLTGEDSTFSGVAPRHPFNPAQGHWGAWQVAARFSQLNIDPDAFPLFSNPATSARAAYEWAVGFDWYLNRSIKVIGDYSHTRFSGGGGPGAAAPALVTRQDESVFFTRVQLAF